MNYLMSFIVGGLICVIGQLIMDLKKANPAYILVSFVVSGVVLGYLGIYDKIIEFGYSGATVTLPGFGYTLAKGAVEETAKTGFLGVLSGGISATASGVGASLVFGYIVSLIFTAKSK
ncbi:stage V sporulation protein AE [Sedimentibacter sp. zth1]|uniref:stage V sporulation protein AE n=1 Tax=Sedimentibacter sp. zth1 TaxID=2816908 RepID=UPI001A9359CA|nr:stage V sporulation protein AE [Sedimentibacter sp. zth1]QSX06390.1 stage V sporulation protein AE [Sedimentibacter sp. zth1]